MRVLVVGSGGREHALVWALARSSSVEQVFAAPGNPGTRKIAGNVDLDWACPEGLARFCVSRAVDLVVSGPEAPLAAGLGDVLRDKGISFFGPGRAGARLEWSKGYAKEFMKRHGVPHPEFQVFDEEESVLQYLRESKGPWVIKADGLAAGKGVLITGDRDGAGQAVSSMMKGEAFGDAGKRVVIEEFLEGREVSAMALCDGKNLVTLPLAADHKRLSDGDAGPMTGGMGAYSPVPFVDGAAKEGIREILRATLRGLRAEGIDYRGVVYAGLMLTDRGPKVLEYNVRFGDPEAQCVLPRLQCDFGQLLWDCSQGNLAGSGEVLAQDDPCVTVVVASRGYPAKYEKGFEISGLSEDRDDSGVHTFFAGVKGGNGDAYLTDGGRVLAVSALGKTLSQARDKAYERAGKISFEGAFYRTDIAEGCLGR